MSTTRLLFLPQDSGAPAHCVHVDAQGRRLGGRSLAAGAPGAPPYADATRTVVVVPGGEARVAWLDLAAHSPAQAVAAARQVLADGFACADDLHLAVGQAAAASGAARPVVAVAGHAMRGWLDRAAALGLPADAMVPEQLLLPAPDPGTVYGFDAGDRWLVRGDRLAFAVEPELAGRILAGRTVSWLSAEAFEQGYVRALAPEVDLLQAAYGRRAAPRQGLGRRRLASLAAILLLSWPLLTLVQALRLELAANRLEARTATLSRAVEGGAAAVAATGAGTHAPGFGAAAGALFAAVASTPDTRLDTLAYRRGDGLRAGVAHRDAAALESLRGRLAAAGWRLVDGESVATEAGLRTTLHLEPKQ